MDSSHKDPKELGKEQFPISLAIPRQIKARSEGKEATLADLTEMVKTGFHQGMEKIEAGNTISLLK